MKKITGLIIMDGYGISPQLMGDAIAAQGSPNVKALQKEYPSTQIQASGRAVGLPDGQMGNSEVGHLNIGAGRIVYQELTRITAEIEDGSFFNNEELLFAVKQAKANNVALHLMGLVSPGGVHSHTDHLYALLELAKRNGLNDVYIHCFMDGRDVPPESGKGYIADLQQKIKEIGAGKIATIMGRYYAMDRDNRWERVQKAYDAMVNGKGVEETVPEDAMQHSYDNGVTDEFVLPVVICENGKVVAKVEENDSVIFFNFRPDRARELTRAFTQTDFDGFEHQYFPLNYVCFTQYDETFKNVKIAFKPQSLNNTFGEYLSALGKTQLRIAETEKYAHVTFFFNGGAEEPSKGEDRVLVPSPKVATYDLQPEMSAYEVAKKAVECIQSGKYDVMILNFANADMVGHTGVFEAAVKAITAVDECVKTVVDAILANGGRAIITADHGNSDHMMEDDGSPFTAHSLNSVPFIVVDNERKNCKLYEDGRLCDVVPTMIDMMGLEQPVEMTGKSLIIKE
ncbi:2,3-bisphosphoglycerate-independent phosphoglycerate mutase [Clostridia bacterium OttesenSCG-928-F22]|nr:2,3-bisphosphoglycerate-independent phosphoglycerate mutase [Clostridia bacterium OttesenSCG-928-F22]